MNLDEMQQRLQALFQDKMRFDTEAETNKQKSLMVQGHINELSFIINSLATPASQPEPEGDNNAIEEGNEQQDSISEHQDGDCSREAPEASGCDSVE